jgi:hypothetical protein
MNRKRLAEGFNKPIFQAIVVIVGCLAIQLIALLSVSLTGESYGYLPWILSAACLLFYAFFNAIILLKASNLIRYVTQSLAGFFMVLLFSGGIAFACSSLGLGKSGSIRWIYFIVTFSYFFFMIIIYFMRKIIEYAQRQDTEHEF